MRFGWTFVWPHLVFHEEINETTRIPSPSVMSRPVEDPDGGGNTLLFWMAVQPDKHRPGRVSVGDVGLRGRASSFE